MITKSWPLVITISYLVWGVCGLLFMGQQVPVAAMVVYWAFFPFLLYANSVINSLTKLSPR